MSAPSESTHDWICVEGVVVDGYGVASGRSSAEAGIGTITKQTPHFRKLGLDLSTYYPATINVSIAPLEFTVETAMHHFTNVRWTHEHAPEDFSFSPCRLLVHGMTHGGLVYYPHPATKPGHFQSPSTVEIIAHYIRGISRGTLVGLQLDEREVQVSRASIL